ncbi:unnamed protein product [Cuscuta campestris]|uniref:Retrotransposon gag domain-containing protein n=1 Tax=Cuscuta campestris TaxID=132261 RepID=A0A484MJM1_9ASTE|nr:unnamed protein product [Cuscuta campestris]
MTTLRELAAPNLNVQPLSITYAELEKPLKLNSGFINLLPKFHGLPGEDPFRHISEFLITCGAMVPEGVAQDQIRLRAFPFSLADKAKDWLYYSRFLRKWMTNSPVLTKLLSKCKKSNLPLKLQ